MKKGTLLPAALLLLLLTAACGRADQSAPSSAAPEPEPVSSAVEEASSAADEAQPLTVEQITKMFEEMYPQAYEALNIFSGSGLKADPSAEAGEPDENGQQFVPVQSDKYKSVEDIKKAVESVFTRELAEREFYSYGLEGQYIRYKDIDGVLNVDMAQQNADRGYQWMTDTLQVVSQTEDKIIVEMDNLNNYGEKGHDTVTFQKTEEGWRFDTLI